MNLPIGLEPTPEFDQQWKALEITESCNTTWASDRTERRPLKDIVMMLAGAAVCYQTRLQPTIAQSSTEAEFTNINRALQVVNSQICLTKVEIIGTSYL